MAPRCTELKYRNNYVNDPKSKLSRDGFELKNISNYVNDHGPKLSQDRLKLKNTSIM